MFYEENKSKPLGEKFCTTLMEVFEPLSDHDIKQLLMRSSNVFCELDHIPVWVVQKHSTELIEVVRNIVNISLKAGIFPQSIKAVLLNILTKKPSLDYGPV